MVLRMLTCEEASRLISESIDHRLPLWERINLKMHLLMCKVCPVYMRQLYLLKQMVKKLFTNATIYLTDKSLSKEAVARIKSRLSFPES